MGGIAFVYNAFAIIIYNTECYYKMVYYSNTLVHSFTRTANMEHPVVIKRLKAIFRVTDTEVEGARTG
jgi:hypothetical protein